MWALTCEGIPNNRSVNFCCLIFFLGDALRNFLFLCQRNLEWIISNYFYFILTIVYFKSLILIFMIYFVNQGKLA